LNIQKGNLLDAAVAGEVSIVMHGCNCFHAMGAGIAGEAARRFPQIPQRDRRTIKGDVSKLASFSLAKVTEEVLPALKPKQWEDKTPKGPKVTLDNPFQCINLYTQFQTGKDFIPSIFPSAIAHVNERFSGKTIGIPLLGCGIAGGDWVFVMNTLLTEGNDVDWEGYVL